MADYPQPVTTTAQPPTTAALIVYALFGIAAVGGVISSGLVMFAPLFAIAGIVAIVIAYVKRDEARGTWLASHFDWLIATFWWSMLWSLVAVVIGVLTFWILGLGILLAILILGATTIWVLYRLIRGYLAFNRSQPVAA